jgi:hypothetical protein
MTIYGGVNIHITDMSSNDVHIAVIAMKMHTKSTPPPILIVNSTSTIFNIFKYDVENSIGFYGTVANVYGYDRIISTPLVLDHNDRIGISYRQVGGLENPLRRMHIHVTPFFNFLVVHDNIICDSNLGIFILLFTNYKRHRQSRFLIGLYTAERRIRNTIDKIHIESTEIHRSDCVITNDIIKTVGCMFACNTQVTGCNT